MFKSLLKRIKKMSCDIKCCFKSSCKLEAKDTDGDGIPDEITLRQIKRSMI